MRTITSVNVDYGVNVLSRKKRRQVVLPLVALGLKPDSSKNHQKILLARNHIWMSKRNKTAPKVEGFLQYLKSIYDIEATVQTTLPKKWDFLI